MKAIRSIFIRTALAGVAALALFSCVRDPMLEVGDNSERVVHFQAVQAGTKAAFGDKEGDAYPTFWTANDAAVKLSLNYGSAVSATITPSQDLRSATFDATVDFGGVSSPYTFYSVSPAAAAYALSPSREAWKVSIPCIQTPTAKSVDEAGIILAAASEAYAETKDVEDVYLYFNHLTAYGRFSLTNLALAEGETVSSIDLSISTPIAGDWFWTCADGTLTDCGASYTITLNTSATENVWFACAPVDVSDQDMYVVVHTSEGKFEQLTRFPSDRHFTAGQVAVFTVDMTGAYYAKSGGFSLVTDASTLRAGDEVIIACTDVSKAMGAIDESGNFRSSVDITLSGTSISSIGSATILTLAAGSSEGTWAFRDGTNYLTSPTASKNYLLNSTTITANSSWAVTIDANALATVEAKDGARTFMLYNNSSPRFTCYDAADKSGMSKVSIYRRSSGSGGESPLNALLAKANYGCWLGTGKEWEYSPGTDQVARSYDADGVEIFTLIRPGNVEELEIIGFSRNYVKGDGLTITINWRQGTNYVLSNEEYQMFVVKEIGPMVWLGDRSGKGFIIKR